MLNAIIAFLVIFALCFFGIRAVKKLPASGKRKLTKFAGYCILCLVITVVSLFTITILF